MFITIDGIDGAGKSSQISLLRDWLVGLGNEVLCVRDPGATALGEAVREILLHREDIALAPMTEMFLYMSARAQLVAEQIRPALDRGQFVISDRYLLANVVYQGCGGGLDVEQIWTVGQAAIQGTVPNVTFLLDLPVDVATERIQRAQDRLEKRGRDYFQRIREGFLEQYARSSAYAFVVSAVGSIESIQTEIRARMTEVLAK